jgi:nucleoside-diphosphate-sugar epimerase
MIAFVTGLIGLNLVEQLTDLGWEVVPLHRPDSDLGYLQRFPARRAIGE